MADRPERLAHININSADLPTLSTFYQGVLGFKLTDRSKMMAFLRCRSDHHTVVLADAPVNGLNHI
ncbi:VOC family protein, partial [Acinetobacter baumannii]